MSGQEAGWGLGADMGGESCYPCHSSRSWATHGDWEHVWWHPTWRGGMHHWRLQYVEEGLVWASAIWVTICQTLAWLWLMTRAGKSHYQTMLLTFWSSHGAMSCVSALFPLKEEPDVNLTGDGGGCLSVMLHKYANNWSSPTSIILSFLLHCIICRLKSSKKQKYTYTSSSYLLDFGHPQQMNTEIFGLACLTVSRCHISIHCNLHILWKSLTFKSCKLCPQFKHRLRVAKIVDVPLRVLCVRLFCFDGYSHLLHEEKAKLDRGSIRLRWDFECWD